MYPLIDTKDATAVEVEIQAIYRAMYPSGNTLFVPQTFGWVIDCFTGHHPGYLPIDARYHDLEHTMQGTLCMARLLHGRHQAGIAPALPQRMFELGLLAILLHDTGYLKTREDVSGTGAKYTVTHVRRSADFAEQFLKKHGLSAGEIHAIQNMIQCTGVDAVLTAIPFQSELERVTGLALGASDLLGQMAAADYVDKLPVLFSEFAEAARFTPDHSRSVAMFTTADDLMRKTPGFWEHYVLPKLDRDFGGIHKFLNHPWPDGPNEYVDRIRANIDRLRGELASH